ncbi:hypothetical protein CC86DRAFT_398073 [Ophiobolus disseminans]|uniref:Aminoglycoside phosphotransferase domain-containing protein n=1 Tax=Ophiobolus disseminans TaxID=1469910 RepID=A0A6A6ZJE6_9PLEO|nr:hypothetical protein CC86DRAFT_398073 [Ophiobolus disseminans]
MATDDTPNRYLLSSLVSPEPSPDFELFPSPAEVRANPLLRKITGSCTTKFDTLNIVVKYGEDITASEAHCLRGLRRLLPDEVPVPEWESLSDKAKKEVSRQLRTIVNGLRKLQQDPNDQFLGRIDRKPLLDIVFTDELKTPAGPFNTVKEFHDWLSALTKIGMEIHWPDPSQIPDPFREFLPDNSRIVFTHADLHPSNIMMSADASGHVLAVIDWHQSGWYPQYWEFCKARFTSDFKSDWATEYIPQFVDVEECYDSWARYPHTLGY